jgi:hypothetical protein
VAGYTEALAEGEALTAEVRMENHHQPYLPGNLT